MKRRTKTEMSRILTPSAKKRLINQLKELYICVRDDHDRETIMFRTSQIAHETVNQFAYYDNKKP